MHREPCARLALVLLAAVLLAPTGAGAAPADDAILPLESYASTDARALAEAHGAELRGLQGELRPCAPRIGVQRHGIAFRRPRAVAETAAPYLTLWVWLDADALPAATDLPARAAAAFRRYGQALFRRLVARSPIFADTRVDGYGVILSWLSPEPKAGRPQAESLAVFADKVTAANFALDTIGPSTFLTRAAVRAFDGQAELGSLPLAVEDDGAPAAGLPC